MSVVTAIRAQVIDSFGEPEVLHADDRPLVAPGPGQLQVKVAAAGVNPVDLTTRQGKNIAVDAARFPMVIDWDAAGTVEQLGDGVQGWRVGDRVAAMTFQPLDQNGSYAQYVNLAADLVALVPDALTLEQAATVPLVGLTGSQLVQWLDLPVGATVLVNGPVGASVGWSCSSPRGPACGWSRWRSRLIRGSPVSWAPPKSWTAATTPPLSASCIRTGWTRRSTWSVGPLRMPRWRQSATVAPT